METYCGDMKGKRSSLYETSFFRKGILLLVGYQMQTVEVPPSVVDVAHPVLRNASVAIQ